MRRRLQGGDDYGCADHYQTSFGARVGLAIGDIAVPDDVPVLGGTTVIGGQDLHEQMVVDDTPFGAKCGALCSGCLSDYLENREEMEEFAWGHSANAIAEAAEPKVGAKVWVLWPASYMECTPMEKFVRAPIS